MTTSDPPMKWNAWGDPAAAKPLSDGIRALLARRSASTGPASRRSTPIRCRLRPSALSRSGPRRAWRDRRRRELTVDDRGRLLRAGGKSTLDLLRRRDFGVQDAPDAVLLPETEDEVAEILRYCSLITALRSCRSEAAPAWSAGWTRCAAISSAVVSLDLRRLNELHALDEVSWEAELGAGLTGPEAERLLGERGFSLGHFPQSFLFATIGGFAATRSSGQDSAGYGRFNDMVRGLRAVTPAGILDLGRAPESAAGPDLRQLLIGSEGIFGIITRGAGPGPPDPGGHPLRGVVVPGLRHRRRRTSGGRSDRHRTDRGPAVR